MWPKRRHVTLSIKEKTKILYSLKEGISGKQLSDMSVFRI